MASRYVHLLKFYEENAEFFHQTLNETLIIAILNKGKKYDSDIKEIVDKYNIKINIKSLSELHKGLTIPRFKILTALIAWKAEIKLVKPLDLRRSEHCLYKTPQRFQDFGKLLVPGFWFVGRVIEDSLSDDSSINYGNPFCFLDGDLGFWWAGTVVMDWTKYRFLGGKGRKLYRSCLEFYHDSCLSRKYKSCQMSAISSMDRYPSQFLNNHDEENFQNTIKNVGPYYADIAKLLLQNYIKR